MYSRFKKKSIIGGFFNLSLILILILKSFVNTAPGIIVFQMFVLLFSSLIFLIYVKDNHTFIVISVNLSETCRSICY